MRTRAELFDLPGDPDGVQRPDGGYSTDADHLDVDRMMRFTGGEADADDGLRLPPEAEGDDPDDVLNLQGPEESKSAETARTLGLLATEAPGQQAFDTGSEDRAGIESFSRVREGGNSGSFGDKLDQWFEDHDPLGGRSIWSALLGREVSQDNPDLTICGPPVPQPYHGCLGFMTAAEQEHILE